MNKINKYAETMSGSDVVTTIEKINVAMVESLWVGKKESIPNKIGEWCEVWLRYEMNEESKEIVNVFFGVCNKLEIEHKERTITFPERVIVLIKANLENLKQLMLASGHLAEIRKMITPVSFYSDMDVREQREWINELKGRVDVSERSNTAVCLLDTGVNNAHPLLESVKILNSPNDNDEELYGFITQQAAYIAETENPEANRTFCMAITTPESNDLGNGIPSSWSASIDALLVGVGEDFADGRKRLMCISAGNTPVEEIADANDYLAAVRLHSVENPGQAWNAITVGAYTDKIQIETKAYSDYTPVADRGGVSPFTSSSIVWEKSKWPIKPEVVFEGGNLGHNPNESFLNGYSELEDLDMITTCKDFVTGKSLIATNMTSPATAQAAWMLANIQHNCPQLWPESIRALLIHSAVWTDEMIRTFIPSKPTKNDYRNLIRVCGYGVPDLEQAIYSAQNSVNLIIEDELQPFVKKSSGSITSNEMHMHDSGR